MDELVYLFELDSVRNSPQEILRAQWAMFREVALKGNRVVLSFNQLTDSEGFLCGVRDPKLYPHLAALFEMGVLKYSRFAPGSYGKPVDDAALRRELSSCRSEHAPLFQAGVLKAYDPLPSRAPQRILRTASHYIQNGVDQCLSDTKGRFLFSAQITKGCFLPFIMRWSTVIHRFWMRYTMQLPTTIPMEWGRRVRP